MKMKKNEKKNNDKGRDQRKVYEKLMKNMNSKV